MKCSIELINLPKSSREAMEKQLKHGAVNMTPEDPKQNSRLRVDVTDASVPDTVTQCQPEEKASFVDENKTNFAQGIHVPQSQGNKPPSSEELQRRVQQQIDDINSKRKRDTELLSDFKKSLEAQITKSCGILEEAIVHSYEEHSQTIEEKLHEIFEVLERIGQLETELMNFKETLGHLYTDMHSA